MPTFQVPAHWFEPKALRRWLWENRHHLSEDTQETFRDILTRENMTHNYAEADIHTVVEQIILSIEYSEIVNSLSDTELHRFAQTTIDFWTDRQRNPQWNSEIRVLGYSLPKLKRRLRDYFNYDNLKPPICIRVIEHRVIQAAGLADANLNIAGQKGGIRSREASLKLRDGCKTTVEMIENLVMLFWEFCVLLSDLCELDPKKSNPPDWGGKELALHNTSVELWKMIDEERIPDFVQHLSDRIKQFAGQCYGTAIAEGNSQRAKVIVARESETIITDSPSGEPQKQLVVKLIELERGEFIRLSSVFRDKHRNSISHNSNVQQGNLPESFYESALEINEDTNKLIDVLRSETNFFPEIVRIISITEGSKKGIEIHAVSVPGDREYELVYSDRILMDQLAQNVTGGLAFSEQDQMFWLFPAPPRQHAPILNPILLSRGSISKELSFDFFLEIESRLDIGDEKVKQTTTGRGLITKSQPRRTPNAKNPQLIDEVSSYLGVMNTAKPKDPHAHEVIVNTVSTPSNFNQLSIGMCLEGKVSEISSTYISIDIDIGGVRAILPIKEVDPRIESEDETHRRFTLASNVIVWVTDINVKKQHVQLTMHQPNI